MLILTDYITPAELTGYARAALADLEQNSFRLSQWLPSVPVDDLQYRFTRGGLGLTEAATIRSYDAESPIGSRPGTERVSGELPPISRKIRLGEYDRLRARRADNQIRTQILNDARTMARAVAARIELARGEALYKGKLEINENGVITTVDFGRAAGHTTTAGTAWSDTAASTPITNMISWRDTYIAANGVPPGAAVTSTRVLTYLMQNAQVRNLVFPGANQPSLVTIDNVLAILSAYGLPPIYIVDEQVKVSGSAQKVIPDDRFLFLPAPGTSDSGESTELGGTFWGTTAESLEEDYSLDAGEEPGLVVGAYSTKDPVAVWTKAASIALPVLANPDLSFAADVAA